MITATVTGRLGKPAEIRNAGTTKVINFSIATDVGFGDKKHSLWIECAKFGDNVKIADYLQKGQQVLVIGEPDIRTWDSNGKSGASMTLKVDKIELLGGGNRDQQPQSAPNNNQPAYSQPSYSANEITEPEDELPF